MDLILVYHLSFKSGSQLQTCFIVAFVGDVYDVCDVYDGDDANVLLFFLGFKASGYYLRSYIDFNLFAIDL